MPWEQICALCGGVEVTTEPSVDEDGAPTGALIATCVGCGRELGEVPPLPPSLEAEPETETESLMPTEDEAWCLPLVQRHATTA
jgi:hypothetical protein